MLPGGRAKSNTVVGYGARGRRILVSNMNEHFGDRVLGTIRLKHFAARFQVALGNEGAGEVLLRGAERGGEAQLRGKGHSQVELGNEGNEGNEGKVQLGNEGEKSEVLRQLRMTAGQSQQKVQVGRDRGAS